MLELEAGTEDWVDPRVVLDSCSSSCLILLLMDSTSWVDSRLAGVDALVELAANDFDGHLVTVDALLIPEALSIGAE